MMKTVLLLMLTSLLVGCGGGASQYYAASQTYTGTVEAMTTASRAGLVSLDTVETFEAARAPARAFLDQWEVAILEGRPFGSTADLLALLDDMVRVYILIRSEDDGTGERSGDAGAHRDSGGGDPRGESGESRLDPRGDGIFEGWAGPCGFVMVR